MHTSNFLALFLTLWSASGAQGKPTTGFGPLAIWTISFAPGHAEGLLLPAIGKLRSASPLPQPPTRNSYAVARKSLSNRSFPKSAVSDESISRLQGRFQMGALAPGYIDITDSFKEVSRRSLVPRVDVPAYPTPDSSAHPELKPMLAMIKQSELRSYVTHLSTKYKTRYYLSPQAREPAEWIQLQLASWLGENQVRLVENDFNQPNVVGRIEAKSGDPNAPIVILGAHLDSTNASGMAVMMSIMRILKANNYQGTYAIEAHAYAGEEAGLLGSRKLATEYRAQNKIIRGMLNFETVGYQPAVASSAGKSSTITVISDPVPQMSTHMANVIREYVPTAEQRSTTCGYGCSDHYSFYLQGYPVVCIASYGPEDSSRNPSLNSDKDTIAQLNFKKMTDFVRVGLAWVAEVAA